MFAMWHYDERETQDHSKCGVLETVLNTDGNVLWVAIQNTNSVDLPTLPSRRAAFE